MQAVQRRCCLTTPTSLPLWTLGDHIVSNKTVLVQHEAWLSSAYDYYCDCLTNCMQPDLLYYTYIHTHTCPILFLSTWAYLCAGMLPSSWGDAGAFPSLSVLELVDNLLTGTLPASWGGPNAFPALFDLALGRSGQVGTLPPEWGSPQPIRNWVS